jgi:hypothetical protein
MQKYFNHIILLFAVFATSFAFAQTPLKQVSIVSFTVKNKLPTDVSSWNSIPAGLFLVAQKMPQVNLQAVKLVVQIKHNGSKICGNSLDASTTIDLNGVKNFNANELVSALGQCITLKPGRYTLCVQFFNIDRYPISEERCKDFIVEDFSPQNYTSPQNIIPTKQKLFTGTAVKAPIVFRWTPLLPKPQTQVIYKLKVWQLMQGQTAAAAIKANVPFYEKEIVGLTQLTVSNVFNTTCELPYLCEFVWNVQAVNKEGIVFGNNNGTSEFFTFSITSSEKIK